MTVDLIKHEVPHEAAQRAAAQAMPVANDREGKRMMFMIRG